MNTGSHLITLDIGTSSTKAALWSLDGRMVAQAIEGYSLDQPASTWAQVEAEVWWQTALATIRTVMSHSGVSAQEVAGIAVDGLGWAMVPVDPSGNTTHPALIWLDRRAEAEAAWMRAQPGADEMVNLSANPLDAAYITPKLLWLKNHLPEVFNATQTFLTSSGFIVFRLTGEKICDFTQAYGYHFFDIRNENWNSQALEALGLSLSMFPRLCAPLEIVGEVQPAAAQAAGLRPGIPVIAGGLDACVGALGAGVLKPGQTVDQGGQAGGMLLSVNRVLVEPQLIFSHHVLPGQYLLQSGTVGGGSLGWLRDILGLRERQSTVGAAPFEWLSQQAAAVPPGAHGLLFLPYMAGERTPLWNSSARGVFFGLSYTTTPAELARSVMEGCAFAVYHNLILAEKHGVRVEEWLGDGGAADSSVWCQIKADITGRPFTVRTQENGIQGGHLLGLFAMLSYALGKRSSMEETVSEMLPNKRRYEPDLARHCLYQDLFAQYLRLSNELLPEFEKRAAILHKHFKVEESNS